MSSQDMWLKLYDMSTQEIQVQVAMEIVYLVKHRKLDLKDILKDIKKVYKLVNKEC